MATIDLEVADGQAHVAQQSCFLPPAPQQDKTRSKRLTKVELASYAMSLCYAKS